MSFHDEFREGGYNVKSGVSRMAEFVLSFCLAAKAFAFSRDWTHALAMALFVSSSPFSYIPSTIFMNDSLESFDPSSFGTGLDNKIKISLL